jgi:hypothetical protein
MRHPLFDLSVNTLNCGLSHNKSNACRCKICRLSMKRRWIRLETNWL